MASRDEPSSFRALARAIDEEVAPLMQGSRGTGQLIPGVRCAKAMAAVAALIVIAATCEQAVRSGPAESRPPTGAYENLAEIADTSRFVTNAKVAGYRWLKSDASIDEGLAEAFGSKYNFWKTKFSEGARQIDWAELKRWVEEELLGGTDPFKDHNGTVPIPVTSSASHADGQLQPGEYVGYTRRQLCYIVAKSVTGARLQGYDNGLYRYLNKKGPGGCLPKRDKFGQAMFSLLGACAADPSLKGMKQGPMLFVIKPRAGPTDAAAVAKLLPVADTIPLSRAGLRVCRYEDGSVYKQAWLPGVPRSPQDVCAQPTAWRAGTDFMTPTPGGRQALVDASEHFIGGEMYGTKCGGGGDADGTLLMFMPEVGALTLFLSQGDGGDGPPQMGQPLWVLGARMMLSGLDGTGQFVEKMQLSPSTPMTSDLQLVSLKGSTFLVSSSKQFVAIGPETVDSFGGDADSLVILEARRNRAPEQREFRHDKKASFARQVMAWYQAASLEFIPQELHALMQASVRSLGSGPWMSGLSFGDSQLEVLAMWIGHALAAQSWGDGGLLLDYYLYSYFMENPGNQCFLHSERRCGDCLWTCDHKKLQPGSIWLPSNAYFTGEKWRPCVVNSQFACPYNGIENVMWNFGLKHAGVLWRGVEEILAEEHGGAERAIFDRLMDFLVHEKLQKLDPYSV